MASAASATGWQRPEGAIDQAKRTPGSTIAYLFVIDSSGIRPPDCVANCGLEAGARLPREMRWDAGGKGAPLATEDGI